MIKPLTRNTPASYRAVGAFPETTFVHSAGDEDYGGFAPTQLADDEPAVSEPSAWATARWVAKQEAKAHEAADKARAVIAAQRRSDAPAATPRVRLARWLPDVGSLLPLFICVALAMALISAILPLLDKP